jgi:copper(I)-binding protein
MKRNLAALSMFVCLSALADVSVENAWVRGTVPAQKATGAFMIIKSTAPVSLVSARSAAARQIELHEMSMENGVMKMRPVGQINIAPDKPTELKPGGLHIMLVDLVKPLAPGEAVPLTLTFKSADGKTFQHETKADVRELTAREARPHG